MSTYAGKPQDLPRPAILISTAADFSGSVRSSRSTAPRSPILRRVLAKATDGTALRPAIGLQAVSGLCAMATCHWHGIATTAPRT